MTYYEFLEICADLYLIPEQVLEDNPEIFKMSSYDAAGFLLNNY